jgi:hypothetical protein
MGARRVLCLLKVLAAVCFAIVVMADHVVIATQTSSAQASSCPHHLDEDGVPIWKPTKLELRHILARHYGWIQQYIDLQGQDEYLNHVKPSYSAYPDWQREARSHPEGSGAKLRFVRQERS